jgi:phenylpyruvate tautomerase PptA (4-oxalocrotonate tautomerase family)
MRERVSVLTREAGRTKEQPIHVLIYEVPKENWGDADVLGLDMM